MAKTYGDHLTERDGWYHFLYTVPVAYQARRGGKKQVRQSLRTRDYATAKRKADILFAQTSVEYESHDFHQVKDVLYEVSVKTAKRLGFDYVTPKQIREASDNELVELMSPLVEARENTPRPNRAEIATLGAAIEVPAYPFSAVFPRFKEFQRAKTKQMNEVDARTFWRRYERYAEDFIAQMGDMDVLKITEETVDTYRDSLYDRVMNDEFKSEYANKALRYIRTMLKTVMKRDLKGTVNPFKEFDTIDIDDARKREAYTEAEVRHIRENLNDADIPDEAKAAIAVSLNTGLGIKELAQMAPEDVCTDGGEEGIPHIKIRKNRYRNYLKTKDRERDIALVGDAHVWMQKFPNGFENYTDPRGPRRLNRHVHKFMKSMVPEKSFVSCRHRIGYLLRNSPIKDQFQNAVMGHATPGKTGYYGGKVWLENTYNTLMEALPEENR